MAFWRCLMLRQIAVAPQFKRSGSGKCCMNRSLLPLQCKFEHEINTNEHLKDVKSVQLAEIHILSHIVVQSVFQRRQYNRF